MPLESESEPDPIWTRETKNDEQLTVILRRYELAECLPRRQDSKCAMMDTADTDTQQQD